MMQGETYQGNKKLNLPPNIKGIFFIVEAQKIITIHKYYITSIQKSYKRCKPLTGRESPTENRLSND